MRAYLLLPIGAFALAGCDSILGIEDHQLARDGAAPQDGSADALNEGSPGDATTDGTGAVDGSVDVLGDGALSDVMVAKDGSLDAAKEAKAADSGIDGTVAADGSDDASSEATPTDSEVDAAIPRDATLDAVSDASSESAAPIDGSLDAPSVDAACLTGTTRCSLNALQTCTSGSWTRAVECLATAPECVDGGCTQPSSCQTAATLNSTADGALGDGGTQSCCASPDISQTGLYNRTYTSLSDGGATGLADPAEVSPFRLDTYLITVGRFRQDVKYLTTSGTAPLDGSGKHVHLNNGRGLVNSAADAAVAYEAGWDATNWDAEILTGTGAGLLWDAKLTNPVLCSLPTADGGTQSFATWTPVAGANENLPLNCLDWYEAYAFCIWDGGFLPSEAEWEYAAAGGGAQREYPWGATDPGTSNLYAIDGCNYPNSSGICTGPGNIAPVGTASLGAGLWGQLDMAGELGEWTLDTYAANYANPCIDCAYLAGTGQRVWRSGDFATAATGIAAPVRSSSAPAHRGVDVGARCARMP